MKNQLKNPESLELNLIVIGASAGGLEALQDFLSNLPELANTAIIVAQHLSPTHKSMLVQLLSRETKLLVEEAKSGLSLSPNKVYITPPDNEITISKDLKIKLKKPSSMVGPKPSVDILFESLQYIDESTRVIAVILSGTGSDGASGILKLKNRESYIIAQNPSSAKYDGMPSAAINTGMVDEVLDTHEIGQAISNYLLNKPKEQSRFDKMFSEEDSSSIGKILRLLGKRTGTDFSNYKSATISRRLEKRMEQLKIFDIKDYLSLVENQPRELDEMFNMILIGVTTFFRDKEAFTALEEELKIYLSKKAYKDPIRIWVPGCSTGEEAYSIAILLTKILNGKAHNYNIQIFATDIDDRAIAHARRGIYTEESIKPVPDVLLENYFLRKGNEYELVKTIRSMVLFSKHDVINNPPFLKLDLISCRNLLIYFNSALQQQVLPIFHYSMNPDGLLFLGKSETVGQFTNLFTTQDSKNKLFKRRRGGSIHQIKFASFKAGKTALVNEKNPIAKKPLSLSDSIRDTLFKTYEHPYVVINESYDIQEVNGDVRLFMSLIPGNIQVNLIKMVNKELQIELRAVLTKAFKEKSTFSSKIKKFNLFDSDYYVRIVVNPLFNAEVYEDYYLVIFQRLEIEDFILNHSIADQESIQNARIIELEHELTATKEHLQTYIEEIETANEELQSLNEEMQSTNEELQSSNEELETSNEELQSTNEEIQIAYVELKAAHEELERKEQLLLEAQANANALLNNDLEGLVLIDKSYRIINLNSKASQIFYGVKGKNLQLKDSLIDFIPEGHLDSFVEKLKHCLKGNPSSLEISFKDHLKSLRNYIFHFSPVMQDENRVFGASLGILETTEIKKTLSKLTTSERLINAVFNASTTGICITDSKGRFVDVNNAYCELYGYTKEELIGQSFTLVVPPKLRASLEQMHEEFLKTGEEMPLWFDVINKQGKLLKVSASADLLVTPSGERFKVTSVKDVTEERNLQMLVNDALQMSKLGGWELDPDSEQMEITGIFHSIFSIYEGQKITKSIFLSYIKNEAAKKIITDAIAACVESGTGFDIETLLENSLEGDKWIRFIGKAERVDNKTIRIFGSIQDISKEKLLEVQIATINKNLPGALLRYELKEDGTETIHYLSEGSLQLLDLDPIEVSKHNSLFWDSFSRDTLAQLKESFKYSYERSIQWHHVWKYESRNGNTKWLKGIGNPVTLENKSIVWDIVMLDVTEEVEAKNTLIETEKRFELLFDQVEGLAVQGYDFNGQVTFWNTASENLYGFSKEEAIGRYLWDLIIPPAAVQEAKDSIYEMATTQSPKPAVELIVQHKTGALIPVFSNHTVVKLADKNLELFCIDIDLRDKKRAESLVKNSERLLIEAQKIAKIGNWNFDFLTDTLTWSEGLYEVFGANKETFSETHGSFVSLVHDSHRDLVIETSRRCQETGEPFTLRYPITTPDGVNKTIEEYGYAEKSAEGKIIRLYGTAQDITEKIRYEESLRLANQRYEYVSKATSDIIFDFDIIRQQVTWSANAELLFGKKVIDKTFTCSVEEFLEIFKEKEGILTKATHALQDPAIITWSDEHIIKKADMTFGIFVNKAFILRSKRGTAYRAIGALQDITKQKEDENRKILLAEIRDIFNAKIEIQESLEKILELISKKLELELGELWTTSIDQSSMNLFAKYSANSAIKKFHETSLYTSFAKGEGFIGNVWQDKQIQILSNLEQQQLFVRRKFANEAGLKTLVGVPLSINQEVIGVLMFGSQREELQTESLKLILQDLESALSSELLRKKFEIQLQEIFEASPDILCITGFDGYFKKINPAATSLLGYSEEELLSRPFIEFTHPEDKNKTFEEFNLLPIKRETMYFENRYITKDGEIIWLSWTSRANPRDQTIYAVAKNITNQKILQKTLDSASELAQIGGWEVDLIKGAVLLTETVKKIYEVDQAYDFIKDLIEQFYFEPDKTRFREVFYRCMENGEPFEIESNIKTSSGKVKWIRTIGRLEYEINVPTKIVGSTQDITTIKTYEESLKKLNQNLTDQAKQLAVSNADLEQFAYIASHDLQEPLRMVSNFMTLLERKYGDQLDQKAHEYIQYAVDGAKRMRTIILDLLEFSRAGRNTEELEKVDINEVIQDVLKLQKKIIDESAANIVIQDSMPIINSFRLPMIQVFQNLINNALKYRNVHQALKIEINATERAHDWMFEIKDNGQGIPKESLDKIFIIFQRGNQSKTQTGTGLGLAIVKKIVENFHGSIWVTSELGVGSSFFFTLPKKTESDTAKP